MPIGWCDLNGSCSNTGYGIQDADTRESASQFGRPLEPSNQVLSEERQAQARNPTQSEAYHHQEGLVG